MNNIVTLISAVVIAAAIVGVGVYYTFTNQTLRQQEISNDARYQCALSSRFTTQDANGNEVWYPVQELYQQCLADKNIQ